MISLEGFFWVMVVFFAVIGLMRGRARELIVTFSAILAIFAITVMNQFIEPWKVLVTNSQTPISFYARAGILAVVTMLGYLPPVGLKGNLPTRLVPAKITDHLFGAFLGSLNGYLMCGYMWYFLHTSNYPIALISRPDVTTEMGQRALDFITKFPPFFLEPPYIYFLVVVAFVAVLTLFT